MGTFFVRNGEFCSREKKLKQQGSRRGGRRRKKLDLTAIAAGKNTRGTWKEFLTARKKEPCH